MTTTVPRLVQVLKWVAVFLTCYYLAHIMTAGADEIVAGPPRTDLDVPAAGSELLAEHDADCWQGGDEPLAELPGAAIVRFPSGEVVYTQQHDLVDRAFTEVLGHDDRRLDTIALCL
jgi:hypothetical protein